MSSAILKDALSKIFNPSGKPEHLPFLSRFDVRRQYTILTVLTVLAAGGSLGLLGYIGSRDNQLNNRIESSVNVQMLSQRMAKNIQEGVAGDSEALQEVTKDFKTFNEYLNAYKNGSGSLDKLEPEWQNGLVAKLDKINNDLTPKIKTLESNKEPLVALSKDSDDLNLKLQSLITNLDNVYLLMLQKGENPFKVVEIQTLSNSILGISKSLGTASSESQVDFKLVSELNTQYLTSQNLIKSLGDGAISDKFTNNEFKSTIEANKELFDKLPNILANVKPIIEAKNAGYASLKSLNDVYTSIVALKDASVDEKSVLNGLNATSYVLAFITMIMILLIGFTNLRETQIRSWNTKQENDETDNAVIRLMEELIPISEGNLKARTTVTEHVTGALADRINSMAESLQTAVQTTRETSETVSTQMAEIQTLIEESYSLAKFAEDAANKSNEASVAGSSMVNQAAEKMEDARNKMQETSKRVKHLGEVSQSIATVTDLIEEMTEKTAILALNTQLKAAESGSEGNAFRVIAEEIRKLSEEAKRSLSTIRTSVENMQSDTQTVMFSIEQTTSNVVEGSVLWDKAEEDLSLIQQSAKAIEQVTQKLNEISQRQVVKAKETEQNMGELKKSISHFNI